MTQSTARERQMAAEAAKKVLVDTLNQLPGLKEKLMVAKRDALLKTPKVKALLATIKKARDAREAAENELRKVGAELSSYHIINLTDISDIKAIIEKKQQKLQALNTAVTMMAVNHLSDLATELKNIVEQIQQILGE